MSLHTDMLAAGVVTGHHYSDLYVRDCPESRVIIAAHGMRVDGWNVQPFRDQVTGALSFDIPFAFEGPVK